MMIPRQQSRYSGVGIVSAVVLLVAACIYVGHTQTTSAATKISIQSDGSVAVPARTVPPSTYLSEPAREYLRLHLEQMEDPAALRPVDGVPGFMKPMLDDDRAKYQVTRKDGQLGGVHVVSFAPSDGVSPRNKHRVLIDLHGGGFSGCWPACAELEAIPLAALMKIEVLAVDYREGPTHKFPAASEDVAHVYSELLKKHAAGSIGIYGCSAGGYLTAMSLAWFQKQELPRPGAAGIFCAGAGPNGGDANYVAFPLGESRMEARSRPIAYLSETDPNDPLVAPINSETVLAQFPPTLIITATRDFAMSGALHTDVMLRKSGVESELHVWDGMFHGFFYNTSVPESMEAFDLMSKFFDRHLSVR